MSDRDPVPEPGAGVHRRAEEPSSSFIDRFQVLGELGRGGMGTVYRVHDPSVSTDVALKIIHLPPSEDGWELDRFQREVSVMSRLRHPGVVRLLETGLWQGKPYLVMELVEGESLAVRLKRESMPPRQVAEVVRQVALALEYAHDRGVVHRDLKPANVLLGTVLRTDGPAAATASAQVCLSDFGMAGDRSAKHQLTVTGEVMGTPAYMAPEQALGDRDQQGPWTDVHGLGALLYFGLCGQAPYAASNLAESLARVVRGKPRPPSKHRADVPPTLEALALTCLSNEPHRRPSGARQVAASLGRFLDGLAVDLDGHEPDEATMETSAPRWPLALAAGVAVIAVGIAVFVVRDVRARRDEDVISAQRLTMEAEQKASRLSQEAAQARAELAVRQAESDERDRRRAQAVDAVLELVRAGEVEPGGKAWDGLVLSLLKFNGPALVERLVVPLKEVTAELAEVTRQQYLGVIEPNEDERQRKVSDKRLTDLEALVKSDLWPFEEEDPRLTADQKTWLREGARRITNRDRARRDRLGEARIRNQQQLFAQQQIFAAAQTLTVSAESLRVARFCAGVIALTEERELAGGALRAYLVAEWDEDRAVHMAMHLLWLMGKQSYEDVERFRFRFHELGSYWAKILGVSKEQELNVRLLPGPNAQAVEFVERGEQLLQLNQPVPAWTALNAALELEPKIARAWSLKGLAGHLSGREPAAVADDINRAIELNPEDYMGWYVRGRVRVDRRDWQGGVSDLSRSLELWAGHGQAWHLRGRARHKAGDLPGAESDFAQAVNLVADRWESWGYLGAVRLEMENWEGACVALEKARALNVKVNGRGAETGTLVANLGMAYGKLGRYRDSEKALGEALALLPENDLLWHNRGDRRLRLRNFEGAQADFSRALELRSDQAIVYLGRGNSRLGLGDLDGARADFQRCLELKPSARIETAVRESLAVLDQRSR